MGIKRRKFRKKLLGPNIENDPESNKLLFKGQLIKQKL
jgi:hypothetical protein